MTVLDILVQRFSSYKMVIRSSFVHPQDMKKSKVFNAFQIIKVHGGGKGCQALKTKQKAP